MCSPPTTPKCRVHPWGMGEDGITAWGFAAKRGVVFGLAVLDR